ncbi:hypothetical protein EIP91_000564 [Steccherinum ochraceum]|uniref:DUF6593 domain-containing protein n=1 Tax=Steccherinum ochraceum TaxID=92696 RepID=A0A4R0RFU7_9APHY|nr:hypothetical protein EIP91_000564 [Steccherinum ochraceum]
MASLYTNGHGLLSRSGTVMTQSPPPQYQPVDENATISQVIHEEPIPSSSSQHRSPQPPYPVAPSVQGERKPSQTRLAWNPANGIPEEGVPQRPQYAASTISNRSQDPSPTFDHLQTYQVAASASRASHETTHSDYHGQSSRAYDVGPSNNAHYYNGSPGLPASYPTNSSMRPPDSYAQPQRRRESSASYDAHLAYPSSASHSPPSAIGHTNSNGYSSPEPPFAQNRGDRSLPMLPPPMLPPPQTGPPPAQPPYKSDVSMYYFRSSGFNSMTLYTFDQRPCYHIDVTMNCFNPTSTVTTIRRKSQQGELVACFEMGISAEKGTLAFGTSNYWLSDVFKSFRTVKSNGKGRWIWRRGECDLEWNSALSETESRCFNNNDKKGKQIARIIPPSKLGAARDTLLEVHLAAQHILDDLVVSSVITERKRQSPVGGSHNEDLFSR